MSDFKKILFPVDLSKNSAKIVPYVISVAKKYEAEVHLLFVARALEYFTGIYVPKQFVDTFASDIVSGANKRLKEFKDEQFKDFPNVITAVVPGYCSEEILKYIESIHIDLVIMGTHGRKGVDKVVFGSVAERVMQTSPVPVLLVNPYKVTL